MHIQANQEAATKKNDTRQERSATGVHDGVMHCPLFVKGFCQGMLFPGVLQRQRAYTYHSCISGTPKVICGRQLSPAVFYDNSLSLVEVYQSSY
jgi:hypothetical protein